MIWHTWTKCTINKQTNETKNFIHLGHCCKRGMRKMIHHHFNLVFMPMPNCLCVRCFDSRSVQKLKRKRVSFEPNRLTSAFMQVRYDHVTTIDSQNLAIHVNLTIFYTCLVFIYAITHRTICINWNAIFHSIFLSMICCQLFQWIWIL